MITESKTRAIRDAHLSPKVRLLAIKRAKLQLKLAEANLQYMAAVKVEVDQYTALVVTASDALKEMQPELTIGEICKLLNIRYDTLNESRWKMTGKRDRQMDRDRWKAVNEKT